MPYITQKRRDKILVDDSICTDNIRSAGELNYTISLLLINYLDNKEKVGYDDLNEVVGVLECCKQEFIRRRINGYEDLKIKENGDVYEN